MVGEDLSLEDLLAQGQEQKENLTFYKLVFQGLEQLAYQNAATPEIYRSSFQALSAGFLASLRPELLPQAVAARHLLLRRQGF